MKKTTTIHFSANFKDIEFAFHGCFETDKPVTLFTSDKHKEDLIKKCKGVFNNKCLEWDVNPNNVIMLELYYHTDKEETIYKWQKKNN